MVKVRVLTKCQRCDGEAYLPIGADLDSRGNSYIRHRPCPSCEGSGTEGKWVELPEFVRLLEESKCHHQHISTIGGFHFSNGEVWDDIRSVCDDCSESLI